MSDKEKTVIIQLDAGDAVTSLVLSILPEQVKMELAVTEYPRDWPAESLLSRAGNLPFAWLRRELTQSGVLGDGMVAATAKGRSYFGISV